MSPIQWKIFPPTNRVSHIYRYIGGFAQSYCGNSKGDISRLERGDNIPRCALCSRFVR